ncbi:DUF4386 domain-containing protein [Paenibacillus sp. sgz5001063]|uniref:DUF4386 domain-containing protein n=1 Tax=Paenibacillus sp. sgz5001063 TaxID=3242474 RepID=UPI0036D39751
MSAAVARTGGISLIVMAVAAAFSYGYIHGSLMVEGDPAVTFGNLQSSPLLFRAEILGWVLIIACDVVAAWALYTVLKPMQQALSLLGAWLRLSYTAILGVAVSSLVVVSLLTDSRGQVLAGFTLQELQGEMLLFLQAFEVVWSIGLILFGMHLLIVGLLAFISGNIPKLISILLLLAGAGYIVLHMSSLLVPEYEEFIKVVKWVFMLPMTTGELGLGLWLLFRVPAPRVHVEAAS